MKKSACMSFLYFVLTIVGLLILAYPQGTAAKDRADSAKIFNIVPPEGTPLKKGASVTFKITINYVLATGDVGSLGINVQDNDNNVLKSLTKVIKKGVGSEDFTLNVDIPKDAHSIMVFTPLLVSGSTSTTVVDMRMYPVE